MFLFCLIDFQGTRKPRKDMQDEMNQLQNVNVFCITPVGVNEGPQFLSLITCRPSPAPAADNFKNGLGRSNKRRFRTSSLPSYLTDDFVAHSDLVKSNSLPSRRGGPLDLLGDKDKSDVLHQQCILKIIKRQLERGAKERRVKLKNKNGSNNHNVRAQSDSGKFLPSNCQLKKSVTNRHRHRQSGS